LVPEHPDLYLAEITLCDGETPVHGWTERFGVRKIEVRGDRFFLNNMPLSCAVSATISCIR
jgi:beta-galactosidase/beta-glucuronidase